MEGEHRNVRTPPSLALARLAGYNAVPENRRRRLNVIENTNGEPLSDIFHDEDQTIPRRRRTTRNTNFSQFFEDPEDSESEAPSSGDPTGSNNTPTIVNTRRLNEGNHLSSTAYKPLYIGSTSHRCLYCSAHLFKHEVSSQPCCSKKALNLDYIRCPTPQFIQRLCMTDSDEAKHFRSNSRKYNASFCFAYFSAKDFTHKGYLKILGDCFRYWNVNLLPVPDRVRRHAQLWVIDPEQARMERQGLYTPTRPEILDSLKNLLDEVNKFSDFFVNEVAPDVRLHLEPTTEGVEEKTYNLPSRDEIYGIMPFKSDESYTRPIYFRARCTDSYGNEVSKIESLNQNHIHYDPMQYPIMFPHSSPGYTFNVKVQRSRTRSSQMTACQFYRSRMFDKDVETELGAHVPHMGKLYHQYLIDAYAKIRSNRIAQMKNSKPILNVYTQGQTAGQGRRMDHKKLTINSSFHGSPRGYTDMYHNAMAIVRDLGKPSFFVTMTANPSWPEIQESLKFGETAEDRPDLVARVFNAKVQELILLLTRRQFPLLGRMKAFVYSIEFQKRGLPHCHMLWIRENPVTTAEEVNKYVSAEIPDIDADRELFDIVTEQMLHGPCVAGRCLVKGVCKHHFPKEFSQETHFLEGRSPILRRRNNGSHVIRRGHRFDNRHVVSYSPAISKIMNSHVNVAVCDGASVVKYIYKYIFKGSDKIKNRVQNLDEADEAKSFIAGEYLGASQAAWRLLEYPLYKHSVTVVKLPFHLPNKEPLFRSQAVETPITRLEVQMTRTKLKSYFELNRKNSMFKHLTYDEIPKYCLYEDKHWRPRKNEKVVVVRMDSASPSMGELFYLKTLLRKVPGPKSFKDLLTLEDGRVCKTFYDSCLLRNLLADQEPFFHYFEESLSLETHPDRALENMCGIFHFNSFLNGPDVVDKNEIKLFNLMEVKFDAKDQSKEVLKNLLMYQMAKTFAKLGSDLNDYGFNVHDFSLAEQFISDAAFDPTLYGRLDPKGLNTKQRIFFDAVTTGDEKLFYLDGPGGTGKTFTILQIMAFFHNKRKIVSPCATTGVASLAYPGGKTAHGYFGLPLQTARATTLNIAEDSTNADEIRNTSLIVIDEVSMLHTTQLEMISTGLQVLMNNTEPFGGKRIILTGDFRQLLPVCKEGVAYQISASIKQSPYWESFRVYQLDKNMRVDEQNDVWAKFLLDVGNGKPSTIDEDVDLSKWAHIEPEESKMIRNFIDNGTWNGAIICTTNVEVNRVNELALKEMPNTTHSPERIYTSVDTLTEEYEFSGFSDEELHEINPAGFSQHKLKLRIGAIVMVLRNITSDLKNGTRLRITHLGDNIVQGEILNEGPSQGRLAQVFPVLLEVEDIKMNVKFLRRQLPIRLGFAITVHKSQCQTLERVGVMCPQDQSMPIFTHGQLYVALSRVQGGPDNLWLSRPWWNNRVEHEILCS